MRRQLIATTALIALAAILVLGIPLGLVESARARSDALGRLEREADAIAAAIDDRPGSIRGIDATVLSPWLRSGHAAVITAGGARLRVGQVSKGGVLSARSGATQGVRVTVFASAGEGTHRQPQGWLVVGGRGGVGPGG